MSKKSKTGLHQSLCVPHMCRTKVNELSSEIARFRSEIETVTQDQSSYVSYEKRYVTFLEPLVSVLLWLMLCLVLGKVKVKVCHASKECRQRWHDMAYLCWKCC